MMGSQTDWLSCLTKCTPMLSCALCMFHFYIFFTFPAILVTAWRMYANQISNLRESGRIYTVRFNCWLWVNSSIMCAWCGTPCMVRNCVHVMHGARLRAWYDITSMAQCSECQVHTELLLDSYIIFDKTMVRLTYSFSWGELLQRELGKRTYTTTDSLWTHHYTNKWINKLCSKAT